MTRHSAVADAPRPAIPARAVPQILTSGGDTSPGTSVVLWRGNVTPHHGGGRLSALGTRCGVNRPRDERLGASLDRGQSPPPPHQRWLLGKPPLRLRAPRGSSACSASAL